MPFAIELREPQKVIDVAFSGPVTVRERFEAMQAVVAAARTRGFKRVLADFSDARAKGHPQSEVLNYAVRLAGEPTLHKMAIAYVGTQDQTGGVEGVAALRGYFYQRFSTRDAALRWLQ